ncbi:rabphilin-3A isoform X2 [Venturia canescens]|uniref:rabphilin-3A isoform X2 n=1 Tax=Venturia canescens TaxID=32260 RepID=UPI001C9CF938|nr:rabphilin-3A isoform X2 [Venturia canescens]
MDTTHGTSGSKGARWVCPNDRQLALRAKLRTGWSVKSGSFDSRFTDYTYSASCPGNLNSTSSSSTSFALTDAERASIIQVIQRAEALDVSEQERVGKLVERLENMKRNVSTVTTTRSSGRSCGSRCSGSNGCVCSCALCGEKFAVLGAGPSLCRDCRKYICQKCGIETTPSYLLTPGSSATSTSTGATTPQHQHNVSQHLRIKSPSSNNKWFLCRICAETREMWKKSGAWFFKGLPKYVLPEKKERGRSRAGSRASGWTLTGGTKSLEPPEQDSSSDDEATRRMTRTRSLLSANCEVEVFPSEGATTPVGQSTEMRPPQLGVRSNSSTSEHERRPSSENPPEAADNAVSQTANRRVSSSTSTSTIRSKSGSSANNGQRNNSRRPNADEQRDSNERTSEFSTSVTQREQREHQQQQRYQQHPNQGQPERAPVARRIPEHEQRVELRTGESTPSSRQKSAQSSGHEDRQSQPSRTVAKDRPNGNGRNGGVWNSGDLVAIRASGSVPPVQNITSKRPTSHGHSWSRGSVLQTQHSAENFEHDDKTSKNENGPQDARSRVQRAAQLLRNHGERHEEWQSSARSNPAGRSSGTGLSRRSQISIIRSTALSNEILQRLPGGPLPGVSGRENMGRGQYQWQRSNSADTELQHPSARFTGHGGARNQPPVHGQQRIF